MKTAINLTIPKGNLMKKKLQILSISLALTSATSILHAEGNIDAGKQKAEVLRQLSRRER